MPEDNNTTDDAPEPDDSEFEEPEAEADAEDDAADVPRPPRPPAGGRGLVATAADGTRLPGALASLLAVVLGALALILLTATPTVEVDDRGEQVPAGVQAGEPFKGLYLEARGYLETGELGQPVETEARTSVEENGPLVVLLLGLPVLMVAFAWWLHRRTGLSRPLTIGMFAVMVAVLLMPQLGGPFFIPALIALAVASFQARKAELPARMAERAAYQAEREERRKARAESSGGDDNDTELTDPDDSVIDVDSREDR